MRINEKQLELVDKQIKRILASGNYYSEVYKKAGITGVSSPDEFEKIYSEYDNPVNVFALRAYLGAEDDVFDPYGGTLEDYKKCYEQLNTMLDRLSELLLQEEKTYV